MEKVLPKAIQAQEDALKAYEQQQAEAAKDQEPESNTEPVAEAVDPPEQGVEVDSQQGALEPEAKKEVQTQSDKQESDWEKRYKVLEGKYRNEVPRLQNAVVAEQGKVVALTDQIRQLQAQVAELIKQPAKQPEAPKKTLLTSKDSESFGEDLVDLVRRGAEEKVSSVIDEVTQLKQIVAELSSTLPKQVEDVVSTTKQLGEDRFWETVDNTIPEFTEIEKSPEFAEFLAKEHAVIGATYRQLAERAIAERNVTKLVNIIREFMPAEEAVDQKTAAKRELSAQTTPSKAAAKPAPAPNKRTYTWDEYAEAFSPQLMHRLPAAEVLARQKELETAYAEGRIVG